MKWASGISENSNLGDALNECISVILEQMDATNPDLAMVFVSSHYQQDIPNLSAQVGRAFDSALIMGCSGGGIIGNGREVEQEPAVSLTVASLPGVKLNGFHIEGEGLPDLDAGPDKWEDLVDVTASEEPHFILLADPFTFSAQNLLLGLDFAFPHASKIGGLASSNQEHRQNNLMLGDQTYTSGAVGISMTGNIALDTVVAQGCRPIGQPMRITQCKQNMLVELDSQTPVAVLREVFSGLSERDRGLMRHSLFLGVVMDEFIDDPVQGDFLIRNVMGMDESSGMLAIGETLKEGQLVQFHLRDADTSSQDLAAVLERYAGDNRENRAHGALLFSCLGRGKYLYGRSDHDSELFKEKIGAIPIGGFFCNGEIGPVSGTTFLHGYTSSFGIFRPKD